MVSSHDLYNKQMDTCYNVTPLVIISSVDYNKNRHFQISKKINN